jgi:hypothetical protein
MGFIFLLTFGFVLSNLLLYLTFMRFMNLKLAEYKDGKFERFVELGEFLLGFKCVVFLDSNDEDADYYYGKSFNLDQKDPLNRFNGLFDGRTYGEGRFVLIEGVGKDNVYRKVVYDNEYNEDIFIYTMEDSIYEDFQICGNLHENPELWGNLK